MAYTAISSSLILDADTDDPASNIVYPTIGSESENSGIEVSLTGPESASTFRVGGITIPTDAPVPPTGSYGILVLNGDALITGEIEESGRDGENVVTLTGFSAERRLMQGTLTASYTAEDPKTVIEDAFAAVPNPPPVDFAIPQIEDDQATDAPPGQEEAVERDQEGSSADAPSITTDYNQVPALEVVLDVVRQSGWTFLITNLDQGLVGSFNRFTDHPQQPTTHDLRWILKDGTSPGLQERSFDRIRVVGPAVQVIEGGALEYTHRPIVAEVDVQNVPEGDTPRVHLFESPMLKNQQQANNIAKLLWRTVERQRAHGTIACVGDERLRPLDSCRMIPSLSSRETGDYYHVNNVRHVINDQGWITELGVQGYIAGSPPPVRTEASFDGQVVSRNEPQDSAENTDEAETTA